MASVKIDKTFRRQRTVGLRGEALSRHGHRKLEEGVELFRIMRESDTRADGGQKAMGRHTEDNIADWKRKSPSDTRQ